MNPRTNGWREKFIAERSQTGKKVTTINHANHLTMSSGSCFMLCVIDQGLANKVKSKVLEQWKKKLNCVIYKLRKSFYVNVHVL